jgi:hypothetical protein
MPEKSSNNKQLDELIALLKRGYERYTRFKKTTLGFYAFGLFLAGLSAFVLLEQSLYLTSGVKTGLMVLLLGLSLLLGYSLYKKFKPSSFQTFYTDFFSNSDQSKVLSAVDLYLYPDQQNSVFYDAAISSNLKNVDIGDVRRELNEFIQQKPETKSFKKSAFFFLGSFLLISTFSFIYTDSLKRTFHFWETYSKPNPFQFTVSPGNTTVEHGSAFNPEIKFLDGNTPEQILFSYKTDVEDGFRSRATETAGNGLFVSSQLELTNSITYRFEMDGFQSEEYEATVRLQPRFEELMIDVQPPSYTQLSSSEYTYPFSNISFYPGSEISFSGRTNKELLTLRIEGEDFSSVPELQTEDSQSVFTYQFAPENDDTLAFYLSDRDELQNSNRYRTVLTLTEDKNPVVSILDPTGTIQSSSPESMEIQFRATDDFGITRAELRWELQRAFVDDPIQNQQRLSNPGNGYTESINWDLNSLDLRPRDVVEFKIRVWDNDEISGPKYGDSNIVTLIVPSLAESFEELDSKERDVQGELDNISDNFRNMENEYEEFLEKLRQNPEGGFEEEQMMEEIREQQSDIDDAVREMNEQFEELRSEMMQNDNVSEETQRAYRELQQLMDELDDPALREAMEELQRALQNMSPDEIEQALENVSFNEDLYRERIERTVELFKQLKMNSDLDKLARQYEDLADRIRPTESQSPQNLMNELQNSEDDLNSIKNQLDNLDQNPPKRSEQKIRQIKEDAQNRIEEVQQDFEDLSRETEDQIQSGDEETDESTKGNQQQLSQQLQEQAEQIRSASSQMSGQQIQVNILALQHALYTLLELSDLQEYISQSAAEIRSRNQGFVELARSQKNVSDNFSITADTLFKVSSELPGVPNQINRKKAEVERTLRNSLEEMVERDQRNASITSREALSGINDLASMVASLIDQLKDQQNGDGGGGMSMQQMIEQMQQMSGNQQQLNQQLQELINDMQGDRLSREQTERLDQLARQQNEVRRQLQEIQRRGGLESGDRVLSELQRMMDDMEDSINDMRGGMTDPIMTQRQQNILSRMLDAEQALQQRGETEEREGTASSDYDQTLPPEMTLQELEQEIRTRLQDPNYTSFSESFQRLIERYFEQLRRFEQSERE